MFLQSSNPRENKILTDAMEIDEDYRRFRDRLVRICGRKEIIKLRHEQWNSSSVVYIALV